MESQRRSASSSSHRRTSEGEDGRHEKLGSGELSLAGSTKGMEDDWLSSTATSIHQLYTGNRSGPQLRLYEKILYGMGASFAFNALVVTNGTLIDYYEDTYELDTSFLSLVNFYTGLLTVFATLGFGILSDNSPRTRFGRRKPYIVMLTPVLALSVAALYSPRLIKRQAYVPAWFAATFMVSQMASSAIMVIIAAWGVGLTREAEDRGGLYLVDTVLDLLGFLTGVFITSKDAEKEGGVVLAVMFIIQNLLLVNFVPTEPAAVGQADTRVPFIAGLHMCLRNRQFMALLKAASFGAIVSTTVNLLPLFLQYVMGVPESAVDAVYAQYVQSVVGVAFVTVFAAQPLNRRLGRINVLKLGVIAGLVYGVLALLLSFSSLHSFFLTALPAGIFGGIVMVNGNVLLSNSIDYDELVTGFRRQSFYQCLIYAPVTFIGVAGSSIPLSIISAIGSTDMDEPSTRMVLVLRLWVTACVSVSLAFSYWFLCGFQLTDEVQQEIFVQLQRRETGEIFAAVDPLDLAMGEGEAHIDLEVLPPGSRSGSDGEVSGFFDLYFRDSEVAQLLDKNGKSLCLLAYGLNMLLMSIYSLVLLWRCVVAVNEGHTTKAMLKSCILLITILYLVYEACRLPAFLWVHRSVDRDLIKWARQVMSGRHVQHNVARSHLGNIIRLVSFHALVITSIVLAWVIHVPMA